MTLLLPLCPNTPDACVPPGIYRDMPAYDYHRMNAVSSGLVKLAASMPLLHVQHRLQSESSPPTAAMRFGTAVHAAILEPDVYAAAVTVAGLKPKAQSETFLKHEREHGPLILAEGWAEQIDTIRKRVLALDYAPDWTCGDRELVVVWDEMTDLGLSIRCKARLDYCCEGWLVDLKTARSIRPEKLAKDSHELGYHVSLAHYSRGIEAAGELDNSFWQHGVTDTHICATENEPPFDAAMFRCSDAWLAHGRAKWRRGLDKLAYAVAMDEWPGEAEDEELVLDLPPYVEIDG